MDFDKINSLLNALHSAAAAGPPYQWIVDAARKELEKLKPKIEKKPVLVPVEPGPNPSGATDFLTFNRKLPGGTDE